MNLIIHHLRKDIRAQRWHLALWLLVVATMCLPDLLVFQANYDTARFIDVIRTSALPMVLGVIVWIVILARLIQMEPITASTSFWLTRPIPKSIYLWSRFLFIVIFLVLPTLLPLAVHAMTFTFDDGSDALRSLFLVEFFVSLIVIWLATYTSNLVQFAGMFCLGAVAIFLVLILRSEFRSYFNANSTPSDWGFYVLLAALLVSLVVEHWRRGRKAGFYIGITGIILALFLTLTGPSWPLRYVDTVRKTGKVARVDFEPSWEDKITWQNTSQGFNELLPMASTTLRSATPESGSAIWVNRVQSSFTGPTLPQDYSGFLPMTTAPYFSFGPNNWKAHDFLQAKLPGINLLPIPAYNDHGFSQYYAPLFFLTPDFTAKLVGKTGTLTIEVSGQVLEANQLAAIPLNDPHYIARVDGGFIRVKPYQEVDIHHVTVWSVTPSQYPLSAEDRMIYVLVDPQTSTGQILKSTGWSGGIVNFGSNGLTDREQYCSIDSVESLSRTILYVFEYRPVADFDTTLTAPNFSMNPKPR